MNDIEFPRISGVAGAPRNINTQGSHVFLCLILEDKSQVIGG